MTHGIMRTRLAGSKRAGWVWAVPGIGSMMQQRWLPVGVLLAGSKYYFENSGAMVTGWKWINGSCYYFDESGVMQSSKWIDGDYVDAEGKWIRGA